MATDPATTQANPWPNFDFRHPPRTVRRVLIENGSGIGEKTGDALGFRVVTRRDDEGKLVHDCYLVVKAIDFEYPFMVVKQEPAGYPVEIRALTEYPLDAPDEEEFVKLLGYIFRVPETQKIVASLYDLVS